MNHRVRLVLLWLRRIAKAAAALFWRALGATGLAGAFPRRAQPSTGKASGTRRVLVGLLIATAAVAALCIALRRPAAQRQETIVLESAAASASAGRRDGAQETVVGQTLVECRAEPAAWDHFLSQRQRKGMLFFGGFVVLTVVLLALGRRLSC